jgi:Glycosyltransferase Family 4
MNENPEEKRFTIAIVAFSNIATDARVLRQVEYLSTEFSVSVIGYGRLLDMNNVRMYTINEPNLPIGLSTSKKIYRRLRNRQIAPYIQLILGRIFPKKAYEDWYWSHPEYKQAYQCLLDTRPAFIHANDWTSLPAAICAARFTGAKVIADFHEYAPLELNGILWHLFLRPLREYIIKRYIPETSATITVNRTIADKYQQSFGFKPIVIMNTPKLNQNIGYKPVNPDSIQLIHHGGLANGRKPELMIETAKLLDKRFHLNFMLIGNQAEILRLKNISDTIAPGKVSFHPSVKPDQVTKVISQYDIGFYLLPQSNYNNSVASPNKFFDFIQAGLAVCIGPSPEMARMCREYGFGVIASSFSPHVVAKMINRLQPDEINRMKQAAIQARQALNADVESGKLVDLYQQLVI